MAKSFRCTIVTPTQALFDGPVSYASVPAWDGQLGVMVGQSPVLSRLGTGLLRLDTDEGAKWFMVDGGFAQVQDDALTLVTDGAATAESLSMEEARAELAEANARVTQGGEDQQRVVADQRRAMAKITLLETVGSAR